MNDFQEKSTFWVIFLKTCLNFGLKQLHPFKHSLSRNYDKKFKQKSLRGSFSPNIPKFGFQALEGV